MNPEAARFWAGVAMCAFLFVCYWVAVVKTWPRSRLGALILGALGVMAFALALVGVMAAY